MASLSHLSPVQFSSSSSNMLFSAPHPIFLHKLQCYSYQNHPRICASLTKKSRASRKGKSDEDLRNDIKEFLSTVGLPHDHVPSTKELSQHGRQDLANIVRRRGYKFIRELLATPVCQQNEDVKDFADNISLASQSVESLPEATEIERQTEDLAEDVSLPGEAIKDEENLNDVPDNISLSSKATKLERQTEYLAEDVYLFGEATKEEENMNNFTDDIPLSSEVTEVERQTKDVSEDVSISDEEIKISVAENASLSCEATVSEGIMTSADMIRELKPDDHSYTGPYSSSGQSLEEKVAKFVQDGELDDIEDGGFEVLKKTPSADSTGFTKSQYATGSDSDSNHGACEDLASSGADGSDLFNEHVTMSHQPVEHPAWEANHTRAETVSNEKVMVVNQIEDLDVEAQKADNQAEISRLRYMLHQKELELTKLKEQIGKEKQSLSILHTKAEKEISEAQKLISEKDAELHAAEESLSGLKEDSSSKIFEVENHFISNNIRMVEIEYWGEGEIIEVAGSFNGWHQRIKMDPVASSSISDLTGSRKSRLWKTVLWLYPGVYEIKFITDSNWTIDPQRESLTRGSILNNILRVDR